MENETTTAKQMRKRETIDRVMRHFGPPPPTLELEGFNTWILHCLERLYREEAQPFVDELIEWQKMTPPKPILWQDSWPHDAAIRTRGET